MAKQCTCSDECRAVIAFCPYCREISPVTPLDLLKGSASVCTLCSDSEEPVEDEEETTSAGPQHAFQTSEDHLSDRLLSYIL